MDLRRRPDFGDNPQTESLSIGTGGWGKGGDAIHRPHVERCECHGSGMLTDTTHHDDRGRTLVHDLIEHDETVHARHLQVECHHVRSDVFHHLDRTCTL